MSSKYTIFYKANDFVYTYWKTLNAKKIIVLYNSSTQELIYGSVMLEKIWDFIVEQKKVTYEEIKNNFPRLDCSYINLVLSKLINLSFILPYEANVLEPIRKLRKSLISSPIRTLDLIVCIECNLRCPYCYIPRPSDKINYYKGSILPAVYRSAIRKYLSTWSGNLRNVEIVLFGGEPTLYPKVIVDILDYSEKTASYYKKQIQFVLVTNGSFITKELAKILAKHNVFVIISFDGQEKIHNMLRKTFRSIGSFGLALKGWKNCKNAGCKLGMGITLHKVNAPYAVKQIQKLFEDLSPDDVMINGCLHSYSKDRNIYLANPEDIIKIYIKLLKILRNKSIIPEQVMKRMLPFIYKRNHLQFCPACGKKVVIMPDGGIHFCELFAFTSKAITNIFECSKAAISRYLNKWGKLSPVNQEECLTCPALISCGGGCRFDAYCVSGKLDGVNAYHCYQELRFLEWMIWDLFQININKYSEEFIWVPNKKNRLKMLGEKARVPSKLVSWR